ncbi:MAG: class I SAM-dependent methyltransferase, partial [Alphaproteobacteria bacterium]
MMTQQWKCTDYQTFADFVPALGLDVLNLLNPQQGENILDLGCGDGVLTAKILAMGADVMGLDAAEELTT